MIYQSDDILVRTQHLCNYSMNPGNQPQLQQFYLYAKHLRCVTSQLPTDRCGPAVVNTCKYSLQFLLLLLLPPGRPTPTVNWWYDNEIVNHSSTVLSERRVKNTLILSRLERKHLKAVFTCTASNNNVTNPISASVTLDMNRKSHSLSDVSRSHLRAARASWGEFCGQNLLNYVSLDKLP